MTKPWYHGPVWFGVRSVACYFNLTIVHRQTITYINILSYFYFELLSKPLFANSEICLVGQKKVTRFKCGGVCLGVAMDHQVKDGISALHILKTWCDIARGLDIGVLPYLDRRVLAARTPPQPKFNHVEFHPPPALKTHSNVSGTRFSMFPLTRDQLNILKASCQEDHGKTPPYTSFVALTGLSLFPLIVLVLKNMIINS